MIDTNQYRWVFIEFIAPFDKIAKGLFTLTSIVQFMMVLMLRIAADEDDGSVSNHVSSAD